MIKQIVSALIVASAVITSPAHADNVGVWTKLDVKVPAHKFENDMNLRIRVSPEFAFVSDVGGLKQTILRGGPNLKINDWFSLSLNGVSNTVNSVQDARAEVQPDFTVKLSNFQFKDRNRINYRTLNAAKGDRWQYANQLKIFYDIPETPLSPYCSYEPAFDFQTEKLTQHRIEAGLGIYTSKEWLVETGYLFRTALGRPDWIKDHFLYIAIGNK